jgi:hypothetical protein
VQQGADRAPVLPRNHSRSPREGKDGNHGTLSRAPPGIVRLPGNQAAHPAPHGLLALAAGARLWPPFLCGHHAGLYQVRAGEEPRHLVAAAQGELVLDPAAPGIPDALLRFGVDAIRACVGDSAAGPVTLGTAPAAGAPLRWHARAASSGTAASRTAASWQESYKLGLKSCLPQQSVMLLVAGRPDAVCAQSCAPHDERFDHAGAGPGGEAISKIPPGRCRATVLTGPAPR